MRRKWNLLYWYLRLWWAGLAPIAGGAGDGDGDGDGNGDDDGDVDEDELPAKVKEILKKERKAKRDAEKEARAAQREVREVRTDLQSQISDLEAKVGSAAKGSDGKGDDGELAKLRQENEDLKKTNEELKGQVEQGNTSVRQARLLAELRDPQYGIASDAVDLVSGQLEVEYNDAGEPQGVKDAVEELLEARPSLKRREEADGAAGVTAGNPAADRTRGGSMSIEDAKRLAQQNPEEFNKKFEAGEIPAGALGG